MLSEVESKNSPLIQKQIFFSVRKRPIEVYEYGTGNGCTLVIGGVHGDEGEGVELAQALLKKLQSTPLSKFQSKVVVIPIANPDGFAAGTRVNGHRIDINRNFPTQNFGQGQFIRKCNPGKLPGSEPETKAIMNVINQYQPGLIITFHSDLGCVNYDGPGRETAERIAAVNGFPVRSYVGYPTPGSLGTYYGQERNIPVITLELLLENGQWQRHGKAVLAAIGVDD